MASTFMPGACEFTVVEISTPPFLSANVFSARGPQVGNCLQQQLHGPDTLAMYSYSCGNSRVYCLTSKQGGLTAQHRLAWKHHMHTSVQWQLALPFH